MIERIIRLHDSRHHEVQGLLPWYGRGKLDALERALVEAHLNVCSDCRAELQFEHQLSGGLDALAEDNGQNPARLQPYIDIKAPKRARRSNAWARLRAAFRGLFPRLDVNASWLRWAFAAQTTLLIFALVLLLVSSNSVRGDHYRTLGDAPMTAAGNVIVVFRPGMRERELREVLEANNARFVDGPTTTNAYVLHVPAAERAAILAKLRAREDIVLAEPIDSDEIR